MKYLIHKPAPPLSGFVENLWSLADAPAHARERIVPSGTFELVINLDCDEIRVYEADGAMRCHTGAVVSGAFTRSFFVDTREHASIMGVHFKPGGAHAFIGAQSGELANTHIDLDSLWSPVAASRLRDALCSATSASERFVILERTLRERLIPSLAERRRVRELLLTSQASVAEVAKRAGCSHRNFIKAFTAEVGITPKLFLRVQRFQRAFSLAGEAGKPNWAQLAFECGYFDQSHMIRDFVEFAGVTPTEFTRCRGVPVKRGHIALV